jgi:hypothetical protein
LLFGRKKLLLAAMASTMTTREFSLKQPVNGIPMSPNPVKIRECQEHFEPIFAAVRAKCAELGLLFLMSQVSRGTVKVEGAPDQLHELARFIVQEKIANDCPDTGLITYAAIVPLEKALDGDDVTSRINRFIRHINECTACAFLRDEILLTQGKFPLFGAHDKRVFPDAIPDPLPSQLEEVSQ